MKAPNHNSFSGLFFLIVFIFLNMNEVDAREINLKCSISSTMTYIGINKNGQFYENSTPGEVKNMEINILNNDEAILFYHETNHIRRVRLRVTENRIVFFSEDENQGKLFAPTEYIDIESGEYFYKEASKGVQRDDRTEYRVTGTCHSN